MFRFLAKQGQEEKVIYALKDKYKVKPRVSKYVGPRGAGIMIEMKLPDGVSKRSVDQYLYSLGIPGARSRKSKLLVIKIDSLMDTWKVREKGISEGEEFLAHYNGKFHKAYYYDTCNCSCCGPMYRIKLED